MYEGRFIYSIHLFVYNIRRSLLTIKKKEKNHTMLTVLPLNILYNKDQSLFFFLETLRQDVVLSAVADYSLGSVLLARAPPLPSDECNSGPGPSQTVGLLASWRQSVRPAAYVNTS